MLSARTFRLFVSSTFSDFIAEREALQKVVFPELERYCAMKGAHFQAVDLRWGITEEAQREHDTMRICLEEVRRCQQLSPRPNFAVLLGDRYGWEPVPARMPIDHWERLLTAASEPDADSIRAGYEGPDLNAIPPVMHLRKGEVTKLREALRRAADAAGFKGDERLPYFASATHQEIALGALYTQDEDGNALHPEEHVNIYVRRIAGLPEDPSARAFIDWDEQSQAPVKWAREKLEKLESQLRERLPGKVRDFHAHWLNNGITETHINAFCAQFLKDQKTLIEREFGRGHELTDAEARSDQHLSFAKERARNFVGRETLLERIAVYLGQSDENSPLILHGSGGAGKSALLAKAYFNAIQGASEKTVVIARFLGSVPGTESLMTLLTELTSDIATALGRPVPKNPESMKAARNAFEEALQCATADRPLVLFLDALDQLDRADGAWLLEWLPKKIGDHTRIVASTRAGISFLSVQLRYPKTLLEVPSMSSKEGRQMLDAWLADTREAHYNAGIAPARGRKLTQQQLELVLKTFSQTSKPLWLRLAYEEVRNWPSWKEHTLLPATVEVMIGNLITRRLLEGENHPHVFTSRALAYLTASRFGLSDEELDHALATDPEVQSEFQAQNAKTGQHWQQDKKRPRLPPILWSRLYFDLQPYLATAQVDGTIVNRWFHREFKEEIGKRYLADAKSRLNTHGHLADTFLALAPYGDDLFRYTDQSGTQQPAALRRVMEQPWQLACSIGECVPVLSRYTKRRQELKALLSNFGFCQAKAHRIDDLYRDWSSPPLTDHEAKEWRQFLQTRSAILRQSALKVASWPANRIFLQLALEENPESAVQISANSWMDRFKPDWAVARAPLAKPELLSVQVYPPGPDAACDVYIDRHGRIVLVQADGSRHAYDTHDSSYLGPIDVTEPPAVSRSDIPPITTEQGKFWPLGNGRWFRWQSASEGGEQDGTASVYDSNKDHWTFLPQTHHHEVWDAAPLSDGGYAFIGLSSNRGMLAIASNAGSIELLRFDSGPNPDKPAGILELSKDVLIIWPAYSDGCGLWLKSRRDLGDEKSNSGADRGRYWKAVSLDDLTGSIRKASKIDDSRFLTLSCEGEVRIWFSDFMSRTDRAVILRSATYPKQPPFSGRLIRKHASRSDAGAADRRIKCLYLTSDGRLIASDSHQGDGLLLEWKDTPNPSFQPIGDNSNSNWTPLDSADMELDAKLQAPRKWEDWVKTP